MKIKHQKIKLDNNWMQNTKVYIITVLGLFASFLLNGICTEYNIEKTYDGKKFRNSSIYMLIQSLLMMTVVCFIKIFKREKFHLSKVMHVDMVLAGIF